MLTFDDRDAWAVELGWLLGYLEAFMGNRNFDGTELGDMVRQRELESIRAIRAVARAHGMPPLEDNYQGFQELVAAIFARLSDERLKTLVRVGIAGFRVSTSLDKDSQISAELIASAQGVLGEIPHSHVADPDALLARLVRAKVKTPAEATTVLAGDLPSASPRPPTAFDYDRDLWAIELGTTLGRLEVVFGNRNFDATEIGAQIHAQELALTQQLKTALAGHGRGALKSHYPDFGELASDVLSHLGEDRLSSLLLIGVCVERLRLAFPLEREAQPTMLASARQSLDGVSAVVVPDRDKFFSALVTASATTAAKAGTVLTRSGKPSAPQ